MLPLRISDMRKAVVASVLAVALVFLVTTAATAGEECAHKRRSAGAFFSDGWISSRIETAYFFDSGINTFDVDVNTRNGVVQVIGYVPNLAVRDHALSIAKSTRGVKDVTDMLIVDPNYRYDRLEAGKRSLADVWTSRKIKAGLVASPRVPGSTVGVDTHDGEVSLMGSVETMEQKKAAEEIAEGTSGVKEVDNRIICCRY